MSETRSVGVVGASYWTYTATVMAEHLGLVADTGGFLPEKLPAGVHLDAKEFFRLALEATSDEAPNPGASISNYRIATASVLGSKLPAPKDRASVDAQLGEFAELLEKLDRPGLLDQASTELVAELKSFFVHLAREGSNQNYVDAIRFRHEGY